MSIERRMYKAQKLKEVEDESKIEFVNSGEV